MRASAAWIGVLTSAIMAAAMGPHDLVAQNSKWVFDSVTGRQSAKDQDRLLIVVQFDFDFLGDLRGSNEIKLFEKSALDGPEISNWLSENAVLVALPTGQPTIIAADSPPQNSSAATCMVMFCLPDGGMLDVLIGYPTPGQFFKTARLAHSLQANRQLSRADKLREAVRRLHLDQVSDVDRLLLQSLFDPKNQRSSDACSPSYLNHLAGAIADSRMRRLRDRFGQELNDRQLSDLLVALAQHSEFEDGLMHLFVGHAALCDYQNLDGLLWHYMTDRRCWKSNTQEQLQWLKNAQASNQPILLRVLYPSVDDPIDIERENRRWPTKSQKRLGRLSAGFAVRTCTIDDVTVVASQLGIDSIEFSSSGQPVYFVSTSHGTEHRLVMNHADKGSLVKQDLERALMDIKRAN